MKTLLTVSAILLFLTVLAQEKPNTLSEREKAQGWILLFDGETTRGWHSYGREKAGEAWKVKEGELFLDTTKKDGWQTAEGGDLVTANEYKNFHLKLDWKISKGGNSGLIFLVHEDGKYEHSWYTGPEVQIADDEMNEDGKIIKHQAGDIYDILGGSGKTVKPAGEWNTMELICQDGGLTVMLNKRKIISTTMWGENWRKLIAASKFKDMPGFGTYKKGKIALQDHGNLVAFRNIKLKVL